jgi:hypothetical protein
VYVASIAAFRPNGSHSFAFNVTGDLIGQGMKLQDDENRKALEALMEEELKQKNAAAAAAAVFVTEKTPPVEP